LPINSVDDFRVVIAKTIFRIERAGITQFLGNRYEVTLQSVGNVRCYLGSFVRTTRIGEWIASNVVLKLVTAIGLFYQTSLAAIFLARLDERLGQCPGMLFTNSNLDVIGHLPEISALPKCLNTV
jgi:hypothetical protein